MAGIAAVLAAGCGNGGSGSDGDPGPGPGGDQAAPLAVIQFPPDGCLTDAAEIRLVIAVTDDTGVDLVRSLSRSATLDSDSLWKVTVPLQNGDNFLHVATEDTLGNFNPSADRVVVRRESALWVDPSALAFDEQAGEALVLDPALRTLFRVNLSGIRAVVSSPGVGSGTPFVNARDVDHVASRNAAIVTDGQFQAVVLVDLTTGARTTLSSPTIGGGPVPLDLHGIAVDAARDRALVVDDVRAELMAVDLSSGERTTISSNALGSGPSLIGPRRLAVDVARGRALVTLAPSRSLLAVDLANGNRTVLSSGQAGSGPAFVTPFDVIVDAFGDRALVADPGAGALFTVDLATGERAILSSQSEGFGPVWRAPVAVALHLGAAPLVLDSSLDALFQVGALSGDRSLLSGFSRGTGPQFRRPAGMSGGLAFPERLAVADPTELFTAGIEGGARTLLSGPGRGAGALFVDVADVEVSRAPNPCITVLDAGLPGLVDVNPITGNRFPISGDGVGSGPDFSGPRAMNLEPSVSLGCADTVFVLDRIVDQFGSTGVILRVNRTTGERTIVSDATHGSGADLIDPVAMDIDPRPLGPTAIAAVLDAVRREIVTVDLSSGDRQPAFVLPSNIGTPTDMVLDFERGFLVTVADPPALVVVEGGTTTVLSDVLNGAGPFFGRPEALVLVPSPTLGTLPSTTIAHVLDSSRGSILAVDLDTGDRVILTK
jgi:hypothetical protein